MIASLVVRLIGLWLVIASQKVVHDGCNDSKCCDVRKLSKHLR